MPSIVELLNAASIAADRLGNVEGMADYAELAKLIDVALAMAERLEEDE